MKLSVIGVGEMGVGISVSALACAEIETLVLVCRDCDRVEATLKSVSKRLKILLRREKSDMTLQSLLPKLNIVSDLSMISCSDFVVECVTENEVVKQKLINTIESYIGGNIPVISNTSSLSINDLAKTMTTPERFIGVHFFNPPEIIKFVEIARSNKTNQETIDKIDKLLNVLNLSSLNVPDSAGFVVNRLLIPYINNAIEFYDTSGLNPGDIDLAMKSGAMMPMGPLGLSDLIGNDVVLAIMDKLNKEIPDGRFLPSSRLIQMVSEGKLGRKVKHGFYNY
jgi:3-hydroxybutyryl-CoA dehydrogenase